MIKPISILIDFDGTCVRHEFPKVGKDIGAVPVLKELVANGNKLILFTMRSDIDKPTSKDGEIITEGGNYLTQAIEWFKQNEIELYGVQTNPTQHTWTTSPKAYGKMIIDDTALGCPLIYGEADEEGVMVYYERPHVDWVRVRDMLSWKNLIPKK
jgi:hypothetical protein